MLVPLPPWPWNPKTSGAERDRSPGTAMTAVRVVPPTPKEASWRPGVYALSDVELAAGPAEDDGAEDAVEDGDEDLDSSDVPPDEHPTASAPMTVTTPMATPRRRRLMP
jgi:hypothetical protein